MTGDRCIADEDCGSTRLVCLNSLRPLGGTGPIVDPRSIFDPEVFPGGYCSNVGGCTTDAECGSGSACSRPFTNVTDEEIHALEDRLGLPRGAIVPAAVRSWGACLATCSTDADCADPDVYECRRPFEAVKGEIPGAFDDRTYCLARVPRPIGAACDSDLQCDPFEGAVCIPPTRPLEDVLPEDHPLRLLGFASDRGYCSTTPNCSADAQCGSTAKCWMPFRPITDETRKIIADVFSVGVHELDPMWDFGACLRECASADDCRRDEVCERPRDDLVSLVPASDNARTFCVPQDDCQYCSLSASCETDPSTGGARCVCGSGTVGNGVNCR